MKFIHKKEGNNPYLFIPSKFEPFLCKRSFMKRKKVLKRYRALLVNDKYSIICDSCYGGTINKELLQEHRSPFVNCSIPNADFYRILCDLERYLNADLTLCDTKPKKDVFSTKLLDTSIYFYHHNDFNEIISKWNRRKLRVNFDNLFIIVSDGTGDNGQHMSVSMAKKFLELPYKNLIIVTNDYAKRNINKRIIYMKKYRSERMFYIGSIELFGGKRCLERYIDITSFLNNELY